MGLFIDFIGCIWYDGRSFTGIMAEGRFYVYYLINPLTDRVFYVGKGTGARCKQHLTDKKEYCHNKRLNGYIRNLMEGGHTPVIKKVLENVTEDVAYEYEAQQILEFGRVGLDEGGILLNILIDGRPPRNQGEEHPWYGRKHSEESKRKMSETKKKNYANGTTPIRRGFKHSEESKEKNRQAHLGKKMSPEAIEKSRQANLGRKQTENQKQKAREANQKKWLVITPEGEELEIVNLNQFAKENNLLQSNLIHVASGRLKQYKGYKVKRI